MVRHHVALNAAGAHNKKVTMAVLSSIIFSAAILLFGLIIGTVVIRNGSSEMVRKMIMKGIKRRKSSSSAESTRFASEWEVLIYNY
jgi:hypothetical protein